MCVWFVLDFGYMCWNLGSCKTSDETGEPRIYIVRRIHSPHRSDEVNVGLSTWSKQGGFFGARPKRITNGSLGTPCVSSPEVCVNLGQATIICASYLHENPRRVRYSACYVGRLINMTLVTKHMGQATQPPIRMQFIAIFLIDSRTRSFRTAA